MVWDYHPIRLNRKQRFLDSFARSPTAKARRHVPPQQMAFYAQNNMKICGSCVARPNRFCHAQTHTQRGSTCLSFWILLVLPALIEVTRRTPGQDLVTWVSYCANPVELAPIAPALAVNNGSGWTVLLHRVCRQYLCHELFSYEDVCQSLVSCKTLMNLCQDINICNYRWFCTSWNSFDLLKQIIQHYMMHLYSYMCKCYV